MAHKMRKFSAGGAQGRYDRRMADIEKDYKIALAKGKNEGVAKAKYEQRKADAEDDRAKRTGADRTATRAAERASEVTLKEARRTKGMSITKRDMAADFKKYFADKPMTAKAAEPAAEKAKPQTFGAAFKEARARLGSGKTFTYNGKSFTTNIAGEGRKPTSGGSSTNKGATTPPASTKAKIGASNAPSDQGFSSKSKILGSPKDTRTETPKTGNKGTSRLARAADPKDTSSAASRARAGAALSYLNPFSYIPKGASFEERAEAARRQARQAEGKAKGGKIMKYAKGGSTPPQPTAAERKADAKFRESIKNLKVTPEQAAAIGRGNRSEASTPKPKKYAAGGVTKEMPSSKAMGSMNMAKGGKAKMKPAAKGKAKGNPFAATKFGAAMMKKSADTKGRAMPKFAKGGSIDGCAVRGKTKAKRVTMKRGGSC